MLTRILHQRNQFILAMLFIFTLAGCSQITSKSKNVFYSGVTKPSSYYITGAEKKTGLEKINWQLLAIQALIKEDDLIDAKKKLTALPTQLVGIQRREYYLLTAALEAMRKNTSEAQKALDKIISRLLIGAQRDRFYRIKIQLLKSQKTVDQEAVLTTYIDWEKNVTPFQKKQVIEETWNVLTALLPAEIDKLGLTKNKTLIGWLDLLKRYNSHKNDQIILKNEVRLWQEKNRKHPAEKYAKKLFLGESLVPATPINTNELKVALLLPMSGNAQIFGKAIYQGFNDTVTKQKNAPAVMLIDTDRISFSEVAKNVNEGKINFIVGPLLKYTVTNIKSLKLSIPILALNRIDDMTQQDNLCYFALAPEDEALDAAKRMYTQGKRNPLLIVPKGELVDRIPSAFAEQWGKLIKDGAIQVITFDPSRQRSIEQKGIPLEGTVFKWQDGKLKPSKLVAEDGVAPYVDAVYIVANPQELSFIKSMLDITATRLDQTNITYYASSRSNSATISFDERNNLNGMQISEIPYIATKDYVLKSKLPINQKNDYSLVRLYAMGVDAWTLVQNYAELKNNYHVKGVTGQLSVTKPCIITRELKWLTFDNGVLKSDK